MIVSELFRAAQKNAHCINYINEISVHNARGLQPIYDENGTLDIINTGHILEQELAIKNDAEPPPCKESIYTRLMGS